MLQEQFKGSIGGEEGDIAQKFLVVRVVREYGSLKISNDPRHQLDKCCFSIRAGGKSVQSCCFERLGSKLIEKPDDLQIERNPKL